jgi:agmatinase
MDKQSLTLETNLFKLPVTAAEASLVIIPVPWAVTMPFHGNASFAPYSILKASRQMELFDKNFLDKKLDVCMLPIHYDWTMLSKQLRDSINEYVTNTNFSNKTYQLNKELISKVNNCAYALKETIKGKALKYIKKGKIVSLLGGDHSTPLGLIEALSESVEEFSILHIDAQPSLNKTLNGFDYSHASIMYNSLKLKSVKNIVQVGIRDYTQEDYEFIKNSANKIKTFWHQDVTNELFSGKPWSKICDDISSHLCSKVYLSIDIDGLNPSLCPGTGMPVPGGLEFDQLIKLIETILLSNKEIIGFDLCEVGASESSDWDTLVATRLLHKLCLFTNKK